MLHTEMSLLGQKQTSVGSPAIVWVNNQPPLSLIRIAVPTLSCCIIIPVSVLGARLVCLYSVTSADAVARSASAARSAFPASAIAADNLERRTIRETAMLADLAKSAVAAQSLARTTSTSVF